MIKLFFDIETIPADDDLKDTVVEVYKRRKASIDKTDAELYESTSFEGTFGRICCIGVIKENYKGVIRKEVFKGREKTILQEFWKCAEDVDRFVGHNIWGFDLPFIYKRSIINQVKPRNLNFARYRNMPIYDTMCEWELWNFNTRQSLDSLAKVMDLPTSKDEMDGSMVWQYYQDGRIDDIAKYCMKDVELTRKIYYKMTFDPLPEGSSK